ncbi:MAG TPA: phospholipase [Deltaproteobacteria bacterium]|nr:phospholipase [Deltaproteobacteria bacterium]HQI81653.1 phospholipase [Deltaproteobacteria bacterium]
MNDHAVDSCSEVLVEAFHAFEEASRRLHPLVLPRLREGLEANAGKLREALDAVHSMGHDESGRGFLDACDLLLEAIGMFGQGPDPQQAFLSALKSLRKFGRAQEALFPLRRTIPAIDGFFREPGMGSADPGRPSDLSGIVHAGTGEDPYCRGGYSLFVPETYDPGHAWPLVVALHGGYGHGRDFLWVWLREAHSRGFVLMTPTSTGRTWSIGRIMDDAATLTGHIEEVCSRFAIDCGRILLTGMSDGGTYSLGYGLTEQSPATAIAPVSCVLPPVDLHQAPNRRICWVHGAQDWMFPLFRAEQGCRELSKAGADVRLRVVPDLSHAYPREENHAILKWFDPTLAGQGPS